MVAESGLNLPGLGIVPATHCGRKLTLTYGGRPQISTAFCSLTQAQRFEQLATDTLFLDEMQALVKERETYLGREGWYQQQHGASLLRKVAYFSMEFGVSDVLPFNAGGLGFPLG